MDHKFLNYKEKTTDLLYLLREGLSDCKERGFLDPDEFLYNRINDLIEDAKAIDTYPELEELIIEAKDVETLLEVWLEREGLNSLELAWPTLPSV